MALPSLSTHQHHTHLNTTSSATHTYVPGQYCVAAGTCVVCTGHQWIGHNRGPFVYGGIGVSTFKYITNTLTRSSLLPPPSLPQQQLDRSCYNSDLRVGISIWVLALCTEIAALLLLFVACTYTIYLPFLLPSQSIVSALFSNNKSNLTLFPIYQPDHTRRANFLWYRFKDISSFLIRVSISSTVTGKGDLGEEEGKRGS